MEEVNQENFAAGLTIDSLRVVVIVLIMEGLLEMRDSAGIGIHQLKDSMDDTTKIIDIPLVSLNIVIAEKRSQSLYGVLMMVIICLASVL